MYEWLNNIVASINENMKLNINEAVTCDRLVRPFFGELGWDYTSTDVVAEDANNTGDRPDYLFKYNDEPKFYLEIKRLNDTLAKKTVNDKIRKYITTNNNADFLIITNGAKYQIYYSRFEGDHKSKLLTAFDLREIADDSDRHTLLELLKYDSFKNDLLKKYADNVYNNTTVKNALQSLLDETLLDENQKKLDNNSFIKLINEKIGTNLGTKFNLDDIKQALKCIRIDLDTSIPTEDEKYQGNNTSETSNPKSSSVSQTLAPVDKMINGEWKEASGLYNNLLKIMEKSFQFRRNEKKHYITIQTEKSETLATICPRVKKLSLTINDKYSNLSSEEEQFCRNVADIQTYCQGEIECYIEKESDIPRVIPLIQRIIER